MSETPYTSSDFGHQDERTARQPGDGIESWRDEHAVHHVPKRRLEDIILSE